MCFSLAFPLSSTQQFLFFPCCTPYHHDFLSHAHTHVSLRHCNPPPTPKPPITPTHNSSFLPPFARLSSPFYSLTHTHPYLTLFFFIFSQQTPHPSMWLTHPTSPHLSSFSLLPLTILLHPTNSAHLLTLFHLLHTPSAFIWWDWKQWAANHAMTCKFVSHATNISPHTHFSSSHPPITTMRIHHTCTCAPITTKKWHGHFLTMHYQFNTRLCCLLYFLSLLLHHLLQ